ncbi:IS982 family transposase [Pleurocapsales cyanobacterium LEGE 06147]|nr:IS982 family transposase [Pleurocapsales cyanobacterium LEGE 06147]
MYIYAIVDDLLKAIGHKEDCRITMSDAEVITSALVAAKYFGGNQEQACKYLRVDGLIPQMLSKSRFYRRWQRLFLPLLDLFDYLGQILKSLNSSSEYLLDSFPIPVCDNIRIPKSKLVREREYRGYLAAKKRYFYGIRVQLLSTAHGIPVEFVFLPGAANDTRGLKALPFNLPSHSIVYCDSGYTDYGIEDDFQKQENIFLQVMRKGNSRRPDPPWIAYIKQHQRHLVETVFSQITRLFPKSIHAVTLDGFLMKVTAFILVFTLESAFTFS